jgi:hypothetical protein
MGLMRKSLLGREGDAGKSTAIPPGGSDIGAGKGDDRHDAGADGGPHDSGRAVMRGRRLRQGVAQFPMQILVPEETRAALRQRSEDTGASIRHIILRSLAADGFPVPKLTRRRG